MKYKKTIILLALVVFLLSIAGVSASEIGDTIASENANTIELSIDNDIEDNLQTSEENEALASTDYDEAIAQTDTEVLGADSATYSNLAEEIRHSGNITLTHKSYTYDEGATAITISEDNKVIDGNGAVIDMAGSTIRAFYISGSGVTIKNLTIKNANYNGNGGAIYFTSSGTVSNCNFSNNKATGTDESAFGGAIFLNSKGNVTNCNFTNNTADYGGAVYFSDNGSVTNCNFINNNATENAGAVFFYSGGEVIYCNFINNNATEHHGAVCLMGIGNVKYCNFTNNKAAGRFSIGGAIFIDSGSVENCNFTDNSALYGGAVFFNVNGNVTNCNFTDNSARQGGAVSFNKGNILYCNFIGNTASNNGGAVHITWPSNVTNCTFADNTAYNNGGAVFFNADVSVTNCNFTGNTASNDGGAVFISRTGNVTICTFADNTASNERGAIFSGKLYTIADTCIFKRNSGDNVNTLILSPTLNVDNFTSFYGSNEKLTFDLKTNSSIPVTNGNILISIYFKDNGVWVRNYTCLSGEGWIPNLPVGYYIAVFKTEYAGFQPINRTIIITLPNVKYSINVTSIATNNRTVNITAKTNVPKDILWDGKLLFILPNGTQIEATYGSNGTWWAEHTFNAYGEYKVNATYVGLDNVTVNNGTITINKEDSTITLDNVTLDYADSKNVTVTTTGATGIKANINGTDITVINSFTIQISGLKAGNHTLTVTTIPDDDHNPVTVTSKITVNKIESTLTVENIEFDYGGEGSGVVSFTGASGVIANVVNQSSAVVSVSGNKIFVSGLGAGTYTLNVTTVPDENHTSVTETAGITVNKVNSSLTLDDVELDYGESKNVAVVVEGATGITAKIDGVNVTVNGYTIPISGLGAGNHTLSVTTIADDNHNPVTKEVNITVNKLSTEIILANETLDLKVGDEVPVLVNLTPAGAGNLTFTSSDEDLVFVEDNVTIVANSQGQAIITVSFAGNENYTAAENKTITVNVALNDASVSVENDTLNLKVDETCTINATINPDTIMLHIDYISGNESVATVDKNGIVTAVGEGTAIITLEVGDDEIYAKNSTTVTVTVKKIDTSIDVDQSSLELEIGDNSSIVATLTPVDAGNVSFTSSNSSVVTVDAKGNVKAVGAGEANITVSFAGDDKYAAAENKTVEVTVAEYMVVSAPDLTKYYNGPERFVVAVTDSKGNPLANQSVNITINGVTYSRTTNDNGTASMAIRLVGGQYNVTTIVDNITVYSTVTVLPTVNATDLVKVFRNGTQFYATFKDSNGDYLPEGTMVRFNIHGVFHDRQVSGDKGLVKLNINIQQGQYVITSMNLVTGENASNNITVIPRIVENNDLTKYYRNASQYTVKVIGDDGNAVGAGEIVTFNVHGVLYNRTTNESGIAKLNINLGPGDYIITAEHKDCRVSNNITVLPVLTAKDLSKKYGTPDQFIANLVDGQGNPFAGETVQFNVNGVLYDRVTDSNGQAKLNIRLMPGKYIITSSYNGASISNNITVSA